MSGTGALKKWFWIVFGGNWELRVFIKIQWALLGPQIRLSWHHQGLTNSTGSVPYVPQFFLCVHTDFRSKRICVHIFPIAYCFLYLVFALIRIFFKIEIEKLHGLPCIKFNMTIALLKLKPINLSLHVAAGNTEKERYC